MKEEHFRNKITWFSFGFSLLVIWVHSYNAELYLGKTQEMAMVYRLEHCLGDGIAQIAVPGFFMISGYLFYRDFTWKKLGEKWQRRIGSVLVPYILWNFLYYLGYVIGSRLPWMTRVVGKGVIPFDLFTAVDAVINYTYNYVFWYLFQLILLILLAPAIYLMLSRWWSRIVLFACLWWTVATGKSLPLLNGDALIYYATAASLALRRREWVEEEPPAGLKRSGYVLGGMGMIAMAVVMYQTGLRTAFVPCFVLCRLFGVAGLWMVVPGKGLLEAGELMSHNFFLYGVHFAFVRFINKAGIWVFPAAPFVPLLLYFFMPVMILGIALVLGRVLRKRAPVLWGLLNGGR